MKKIFAALLLSTALLLSGCSGPDSASSAPETETPVLCTFPAWVPAWESLRAQAHALRSQPTKHAPSPAPAPETGVFPEEFGAKGDGVADDLAALTAAAQAAADRGVPLELTAGATYRFGQYFELPSNLTLHGNGAVLLSDLRTDVSQNDRPAVTITGDSNTDRKHDIRLENITFRAADSCQSNVMLRLMRTRDVTVTGCTFDCEPNDQSRSVADVYGVNENIVFQKDTFRQLSASEGGGLWVRNWTDQAESRNIQFLGCDFYKAGGDEVLAVWGWGGVVRDVLISGCNFYQVDTPEVQARGYYPAWGITLGQSGETYVRMEHCKVRFSRCETIFRMVGDQTHAVVDDCDIAMIQPDDFPQHDAHVAANPMLARGNNRADGSTVFQNCRVSLTGDPGRRICYQVSALRNNTFNVNLGLGVTNSREIVGNTFLGTMRDGVFLYCDTVKNNTVIAKTASNAWLSDGSDLEAENSIQLDVTGER